MRRDRLYMHDIDEEADDRAFHRRHSHHHKSEAARRGSSSYSYDRTADDDARPASRRRFDDGDGFERRSRYMDRDHRDREREKERDRDREKEWERDMEYSLLSSPRGSRMRRSESFSLLTRSISRGFRTERDRPRGDQRSSSWRSGSWKDGWCAGDGELLRSPAGNMVWEDQVPSGSFKDGWCAGEPAGNMVSEDQAPSWSKDSHSCEQSRSVGMARAEEVHSSSEMEEGELQPELEPEVPESKEVDNEANSQIKGDADDECSLLVKEQANVFENSNNENGVTKGNEDMHEGVLLEDRKDELSIVVEEAKGTPEQISNVEIMQEEEEEVVYVSTGERDINLNMEAEGGDGIDLEVMPGDDIDLEVMPAGMIDSFDPIEVSNVDTLEKTAIDGLKVSLKDKGKSIVDTFLPITTELCELKDSMEGPSAGGFELVLHPSANNVEKKAEENTFEPLDLSLSLTNLVPDRTSRPAHISSGRNASTLAWALPSTLCTNSDAIPTSISFSGSHQFNHNPSCSFNQNSLENYEQSVGSRPFFQGVDQFPKGTIWQSWPSNETKHKELAGSLFERALMDSKSAHHSSHSIEDPHHHSIPYGPPMLPNLPVQVTPTLSLGSRGTVSEHDKWALKKESNLSKSATKTKQKEEAGLLFDRVLADSKGARHSSNLSNFIDAHRQYSILNALPSQPCLPRQLSRTLSIGSHDACSEHADDERSLKRESTGVFFRSEQREGGYLICNSVVESILSKAVTEPLHTVGRMFQDMTDRSITYLKEAISELISSTEKPGQLHALQETLKGRSDITMERLLCCQRTLLEILVALKTGLSDFLLRASDLSSSDLSEIYLNIKCCNLACRSILPVDDCECKVCIKKKGFCNACMCLVCSKFDMAANTCSWVGCDFCLHWCHTDCGLRGSHIRNGQSVSATRSASGVPGTAEMQFHCVACNHPSEMFGFVKEVFKTCAKDWKAETLSKELKYVRSIFSSSCDVRGAKLHDVADQMLVKLENMADPSEVLSHVMSVFTEGDPNIIVPPGVTSRASRMNVEENKEMASSSKDPMQQLPSIISDTVPNLSSTGYLPSRHFNHISRQTGDAHLQTTPKQSLVVDELESIVRFKLAEAKVYQERADDARRESEGLKGIILANNAKIEEDYVCQITKLSLAEAEERRRKKLEDLQALERENHEYLSMKRRMDTEIKDLLFKLEAARPKFKDCGGER